MYVHLPRPSLPVFCFGEMCWWDSHSAMCVVLAEVSRKVSGILPTARSGFAGIHFYPILTAEFARGPSNWACLLWKRWCHTIGINPSWLLRVSSEFTVWHTSVRLCHQFPVQIHPVLLNSNSVPPLLACSQATLRPSSTQLRSWKLRCFGFWTPCVCLCLCVVIRVN